MQDLPLTVEQVALSGLELEVGGWRRRSTVVTLAGGGQEGEGEDVTYVGEEQDAFQVRGAPDGLCWEFTLASFSAALDAVDPAVWFPEPPAQEASWHSRRWALESAALSLALRQAGISLSDWLGGQLSGRLDGEASRPVRFLHSVGLGTPPELERLDARRALLPDLRFKLDWDPSWDGAVLARLAAMDAVDVVDFKGHYVGAFSGPPADAAAYARVADALPQALLEDPAPDPACLDALAPHRARVTWDAPLHAVADLEALPWTPRVLNVKPSRFGTLAELLRALAWMDARSIDAYLGGQFELGPGRRQLAHWAASLCPEAPNDIAPAAYHAWPWPAAPPASPLAAPHRIGNLF